MTIVLHGRAFLLAWRREVIEVEKLKNENLTAKLESLKNQVNPHFLFNSLNTLNALVYADQDKAADFIEKLAEVYRYVLDHQHDKLVSLGTEMELVKSYVYLNKIRFGENFQVEYKGFDTVDYNAKILPLTLQMLPENCFKHNEISKAHNLKVELQITGQEIIISNNLNSLSTPKRDSSNLGLSNVRSRYAYFTDRKVRVEKEEDQFMVAIPILKTSNS